MAFESGVNLNIISLSFFLRKKGKILPLKTFIPKHSLRLRYVCTDEVWVLQITCLIAARPFISLCTQFPVEPKYKMETFLSPV